MRENMDQGNSEYGHFLRSVKENNKDNASKYYLVISVILGLSFTWQML